MTRFFIFILAVNAGVLCEMEAQQTEGSDVAGAPSVTSLSLESSYEMSDFGEGATTHDRGISGAAFDFLQACRDARITPFWNALKAARISGRYPPRNEGLHGAAVFKSLNATLADRAIELRWIAEKAESRSGFAVDRSFDGARWEEIGFVEKGQDLGSSMSYGFIDKVTALDMNRRNVHFRLRYQDDGARLRKSQVVTIALRSTQRPVVLGPNSPNPFRSGTTIPFFFNESEQAGMYLLSPVGNHVQRVFPTKFFEAGSHSTTFSADNDVPPGIYVCVLETGSCSFRRTVAVGF